MDGALRALYPPPVVPGYRVGGAIERRPGIGVTFGGERLADGAPVEVTLFSLWLSHDARFRRRLAHAGTYARFAHPSVAPLLETGETPRGRHAVVAAPDGARLDRLIAEGPLAPRRALAALAPVAEALDALHRAGLTHGDLRARKIHVAGDGAVVAEAGLIDPMRSALAQPEHAARILAGTAPELLTGRPPRPWTDVFGLAVVVYECVTGRLPFPPAPASNAAEAVRLARRQRADAVPTAPLEDAGQPDAFIEALVRALDEEPALRPSSASALIADLEAAAAPAGAAARGRGRRSGAESGGAAAATVARAPARPVAGEDRPPRPPSRRRALGTRDWILLFLAGTLAGAALVAAAADSSKRDRQQEARERALAERARVRAGQEVLLPGLRARLHGVEVRSELPDGTRATGGDAFLVARLTVTNTSARSARIGPRQFRLQVGEVVHTQAPEAAALDDALVAGVALAPSQRRAGRVVFRLAREDAGSARATGRLLVADIGAGSARIAALRLASP